MVQTIKLYTNFRHWRVERIYEGFWINWIVECPWRRFKLSGRQYNSHYWYRLGFVCPRTTHKWNMYSFAWSFISKKCLVFISFVIMFQLVFSFLLLNSIPLYTFHGSILFYKYMILPCISGGTIFLKIDTVSVVYTFMTCLMW